MAVSPDSIVKALVQHRAQLIGFAWVVVGDPQLAEDVYQDVSMAAVKKAGTIVDDNHLLHWLRHAVRLRALEIRRNSQNKARLLSPEVLDLLEQTRQTHSGYREEDQAQALHDCLTSLGEWPRQLLNMRYADGMKPAEIAEKSNRSIHAIYKTISRIHARLRDCVTQRLARADER